MATTVINETISFGPLDMMLRLESETFAVTLVTASDGEPS